MEVGKLVETWNSEVEEIELDGVMSMFFNLMKTKSLLGPISSC